MKSGILIELSEGNKFLNEINSGDFQGFQAHYKEKSVEGIKINSKMQINYDHLFQACNGLNVKKLHIVLPVNIHSLISNLQMCQLEELGIFSANISIEDVTTLGNAVSESNTIRSLCIEESLTLDSAITLVEQLARSKLISLSLQKNRLFSSILKQPVNSEKLKEFGKAFFQTSIEVLDLSSNDWNGGDVSFTSGFSNETKVTTLILNDNGFTNSIFKELVTSCQTNNVRQLILADNNISCIAFSLKRVSMFPWIVDLPSNFACTKLERVDLRNNDMPRSIFRDIAALIPGSNLREVLVSSNNAQDISYVKELQTALEINREKLAKNNYIDYYIATCMSFNHNSIQCKNSVPDDIVHLILRFMPAARKIVAQQNIQDAVPLKNVAYKIHS